ncbi:hypothetical protein [Nioella sediminis]|jgi:hypothetical protein|uniref:hypothetical protein n=1 Tax=Nioella sediminis TaxID=1912092 RepID=UPI0008FD661C|nr:hypothetical protein [Nioella sediminis]TBX15106.1 hypothetical protein TK43_18965 [Roseovarius sp. JS7-11]
MPSGDHSGFSQVYITKDVHGSVASTLARAGTGTAEIDPASLERLLTTSDETICVIWDQPDREISSFLADGRDPSAVIEDWCRRHDAIIELFLLHLDRIRLVDAATLSPIATKDELASLASILQVPGFHISETDSGETGSVLARLVAALAASKEDVLGSTISQMEKHSLTPVAKRRSTGELLTEAASEIAKSKEENAISLRQKEQAARDMERAFARALSDLRTEAGARKSESDARDAAETRLEAVIQERNAAIAELGSLRASLSWRITRPLRFARTLVRGFRHVERPGQSDDDR